MDWKTIDITAEVLESFDEYREVVFGETRRLNYDLDGSLDGEGGGLFQAFFGFIMRGVEETFKAIKWTLTGLASLVTQGILMLYQLDWGMSDDEIDQILSGQNQALAATLGDLVGFAGARLATLSIVGAARVKFPVVSTYLYGQLLADTGEETIARVGGVIYQLCYTAMTYLVYGGLKLGKWVLRRLGINVPKGSERWTKENISLAAIVERNIERIPIPSIRAFVESAVDSFIDETLESIMILGMAGDEFLAAQRAQGTALALGPERAVRITPDKEVPGEEIVLRGPQDLVIHQLDNVTVQHTFLWNRDVGAIVGEPIEEAILRRPQSLRITIQFRSVPRPPWIDQNGLRARSVTYTIPNVRKGSLDWRLIKNACGGSNGYTWGPFMANCITSGGSRMRVYGATPAEAEQRLRAFLTLSEDEIATLTVTEEKTEGVRAVNPTLIKRPTQIYPAYLTIYSRKDLLDSAGVGRERVQSRAAARARIPLWTEEPPPDFERIVTELLTRGTTRPNPRP